MLKILSVNFPFLDKPSKTKARPALALTKPLGKYKVVIVAFITSQLDDEFLTDVKLEDTLMSGLTKPSRIVLHKLYSAEPEQILGELGTLSDKQEQEVKEKLRTLFSL